MALHGSSCLAVRTAFRSVTMYNTVEGMATTIGKRGSDGGDAAVKLGALTEGRLRTTGSVLKSPSGQ